MTKLKSKKMTKSTLALIIMAVAMVAMLAFGGTYAYFTAQSKSNTANITAGTLTLGGADINGTITISDVAKIVPNQSVSLSSADAVVLGGNTVAALRVKIVVGEVTQSAAGAKIGEIDESKLTVAITATTGYTWTKHTDGYYYLNKTVVGTTNPAMSTYGSFAVALASDAGNEWQGATCTFSLVIEAAQAEYAGDATVVEAGSEIAVATAAALTWPQA
ncbi:MAG: SipW-dependent-type signal peptide-containing protein [Clostridia bacterium]|nr:SipW-dependent-type signal peptide-containing protein [Clostridia bacterium]